jgi:hypothetical protein
MIAYGRLFIGNPDLPGMLLISIDDWLVLMID